MIHGLDTGFLVAAEVAEHMEHSPARQTVALLVVADDRTAGTRRIHSRRH